MLKIKQGDAYSIPVSIELDGERVTSEHLGLLASVEFMLGEGIRKVYPDEVVFNSETNFFLVPLEQEDTFSLDDGERVSFDTRVEFVNGDVIGVRTMPKYKIIDALSEEVLE